MPTIKLTLAEAQARTLSAADKTRLAKLAAKPDSEIDFSEQPEITDAAIAAGHFRVVGRGGRREGAGRRVAAKPARPLNCRPPPCVDSRTMPAGTSCLTSPPPSRRRASCS